MHERCFEPAQSKGLLRRRWPRFRTDLRISARVASLDLDLPVRNVSYGGFNVEAPMRFVAGEIHEFLLVVHGGPEVRVRARAAHSVATGEREGRPTFTTGWEALGDGASSEGMVELVDHILELTAATASAADRATEPGAM